MQHLTTKDARWLRRLAAVPRWAVMPTIKQQSVAEHSFHVCCLALWLLRFHAEKDQETLCLHVLLRALEHDKDEAKYGDTPSPTKPRPNYHGKSQAEIVVKCADKLEAILFVYEEQLLGNRIGTNVLYDDVFQRFLRAWDEFDLHPDYKYSGLDAAQVVELAKSISYFAHDPHPVLEEDCGNKYEY